MQLGFLQQNERLMWKRTDTTTPDASLYHGTFYDIAPEHRERISSPCLTVSCALKKQAELTLPQWACSIFCACAEHTLCAANQTRPVSGPSHLTFIKPPSCGRFPTCSERHVKMTTERAPHVTLT